MSRAVRLALAIVIAAAATGGVSLARAAGGVTVELTANRVTKTQGKEVLASAEQAQPGDVLEYRARYRNTGANDARDLSATLPIPRGTLFVAGTAEPRRVEASLDGHTFAPVPLKRLVHLPDGKNVVREVPVAEYRALRWALGTLPARQSRTVVARVRIEPATVAVNER